MEERKMTDEPVCGGHGIGISPVFYEKYLDHTHRLGRLFTAAVLVLLLAAPFVIGLFLNAQPNFRPR